MFSCPLQKIFSCWRGEVRGRGECDALLSSAKNIFLLQGDRGRGDESAMFTCPLQKLFSCWRGMVRGRGEESAMFSCPLK
jgi:hypothetical protein